MNRTGTNKNEFIQVVVFTVVLVVFGIFFFAMPHKAISFIEKRKLSVMPVFSWDNLSKGKYTDSLDLFFADNFPFRENFVEFAFQLKEARGLGAEDFAFYRTPTSIKPPKCGKTKRDTLDDSSRVKDGEGDIVNNWIFICQGRALQMFGGTNGMALAYAATINKYQALLKDKVTIYNIVVPTATEFYLPKEYLRSTVQEKPNIDLINNNLSSGVRAVDAYSELLAHKNEYLYLKTDHHWTVLGAYYAYKAFCRSAGFTPLALNSMVKKSKPNYIGSMYDFTHDKRLLDSPDTVDYYIIPGNYKTFDYYTANQKLAVRSQLLVEYGWGYGVFLGGDFPLIKVETGVKNGKSVLLVKNSYGNPFAPFLAAHYENVYIVDYRYFNLGLINFIIDNNVNDLIFLNCSMLANADWHIRCINNIMYYRNVPIHVPKDSLKLKHDKDSIITKHVDSLK